MHADSPEKEVCEDNEFNSSPETTPKNSRKALVDIPKRKLLDEPKNSAQNMLKMLKKSPRGARPEPARKENTELPIVRMSKTFFSMHFDFIINTIDLYWVFYFYIFCLILSIYIF